MISLSASFLFFTALMLLTVMSKLSHLFDHLQTDFFREVRGGNC